MTGIAPEQNAEPKISLPPLEPTLVRIDTPEWNEAAREWREARGILKDAEAYEGQCKEKLIALALSTGKSKVKGADVSLSVDKNGIPEEYGIRQRSKLHEPRYDVERGNSSHTIRHPHR